jgi:hypothetical protein
MISYVCSIAGAKTVGTRLSRTVRLGFEGRPERGGKRRAAPVAGTAAGKVSTNHGMYRRGGSTRFVTRGNVNAPEVG